jgi:ribosomal protein S18 acetylase RimI-like enzyme
MIGFIEISLESWNRRLRISNIWVNDSRRHQGLGSRLMNKAMERAKVLGARAIVLETQSCNDKAISFYKKHGFIMIGFDLISYSNEDINKKEVRIEMGKIL